MTWKLVLVIIFSSCKVQGRYKETASSTKAYDVQVPGVSPIRVFEGAPVWETDSDEATTTRYRQRMDNDKYGIYKENQQYTTGRTKSTLNDPFEQSDGKSTEDSAQALKDFLSSYSEKIKRNKSRDENFELVPLVAKREEARNRLANLYLEEPDFNHKSNKWDLLQKERNKHPFDNRKGWVSLEAVPWSVSKISKWQSSHQKPVTSEIEIDRNYKEQKPYKSGYDYHPSNYPPMSHTHDESRYHESNYDRPAGYFAQKTQQNQKYPLNTLRPTQKPFRYAHEHDENCNHEIITDGLPANFPANYAQNHDYTRRRATNNEFVPDSSPLNGEGEWVLLSTTKGYKKSKPRERSMQAEKNSVSTHRSVRLTVLPPLKNSKVNMTTSHGGLLQVESTFQTVEQARRAFIKRQRLKLKPTTKKPIRKIKRKFNTPTAMVSTISQPIRAPDTSAVLAAVGAGMIPATMAMLVPMAIGGRRKRGLGEKINPRRSAEITIPRSL